jgi:acyl-CoA thioester hydrolase
MLASTACRFKKPLFYPGTIVVKARMDFIKTTSFGIHHVIIDHAGDIAAEAEDVIVMFNFSTGAKIPFPPDLRREVEKLEGKTF